VVVPVDLTWLGVEDPERLLFSLGVAGVVLVVLVALQWAFARGAARAARGAAPTALRAVPLRVAGRTRLLVLVFVALYAGFIALEPPSEVRTAVHAVLVAILLLQCASWGSDLIAFWSERYRVRAAEHDAAAATATAFALRFMGSLLLWVILVLLGLENAGVEITTLVAGLGIGGIAIALAAQSVLGDFFASLAIVLDRPFVVGDFIAVDNLRGTVERVGVKTTRVRSIDGEQLVFPNSDLVRSRIRNFGRLTERRVVLTFELAHGTPASAVEAATRILRQVLAGQREVRPDREHLVSIAGGTPELEAVYHVRSPDFRRHMDIQQEVQLQVLREFGRAGISLGGAPPEAEPEPEATSAD